jgi:hypothetical protein
MLTRREFTVGAGALAAARQLADAGVDVTVFEARGEVDAAAVDDAAQAWH